MKLSYDYDTEYFERLSLTETKERGDMHASYLMNKLTLNQQGKLALADWFLAVHQGIVSRSKEMKVASVPQTVAAVVSKTSKTFKLSKPVKKAGLF
jgi:hypothetical protein